VPSINPSLEKAMRTLRLLVPTLALLPILSAPVAGQHVAAQYTVTTSVTTSLGAIRHVESTALELVARTELGDSVVLTYGATYRLATNLDNLDLVARLDQPVPGNVQALAAAPAGAWSLGAEQLGDETVLVQGISRLSARELELRVVVRAHRRSVPDLEGNRLHLVLR
jgi:hypothetical protein